jgi:DNA-binding SARP family transcriptional activator
VTITRRSPRYLIHLRNAQLDLTEFGKLASCGHSALAANRYEDAVRLLLGALALWRGPPLANVSEQLSCAESPRLEEARISAVENLVEVNLSLRRHAQVLAALTRLVARYPLRERFRAQRMTTLYRCDRQAEALALYESRRQMLSEKPGIEPGLLLREVHRAILTADPALLGASAPDIQDVWDQPRYRRWP